MDPPPSATATKLRLMCSYGGQILPRPHTKSLHYAGGDTRIISIPAPTSNLTLSSLTTHLASALHVNYPFNLKYQLPSHDLDSLISLATDEDLLIMLDEHHRLSPAPSRVRLYLFPSKPTEFTRLGGFSNVGELRVNELRHPKTETWFADVLKSAKIMQKGGVGFGGEGQSEGNGSACCGGGEVAGVHCGAESMVLETSSSFGSTSSSVSLSNLPAKGPVEDHGVTLLDNKVKLPASESFPSDNSVATAVSHPQAGTYQDPVALVAMENKNSMTPLESERKILDPATGVEMHKTVQVSGIPLSVQYDQPQVQFVHTTAPHLPQNPTGMMPVSSYYIMNSTVPQLQMYYHTNQPPPVYFVPVGHPYNLPVQSSLFTPATFSATRPPAHPKPSPAQVAHKVSAASPVPEIASQVYRTLQTATSISHVNVPHSENHQQTGGLPQVTHQSQSIGNTSTETVNYTNELDDDPVRVQIYKSQPPPPQYQTMTKATSAVILSEALAQLHTDSTNQQLTTSLQQ